MYTHWVEVQLVADERFVPILFACLESVDVRVEAAKCLSHVRLRAEISPAVPEHTRRTELSLFLFAETVCFKRHGYRYQSLTAPSAQSFDRGPTVAQCANRRGSSVHT